mmetsp:Transcript_172261/g.552227  ORF Transcript_172261/g.552227 Transcript_172261/m.552227 type:complete len:271 (+) Transcript_172261:865-1677(+)
MAATDERHRLPVVHAHAAESIADVQGAVCGARVRLPDARRYLHDGTFGVQVDQANGRAAQGLLALTLRRTGSHQLLLLGGAQVQAGGAVGIVDAAHAELRHRSAHALDRGTAGGDEQISPAEPISVLFLDWPQQGACMVEVRIVLPVLLRRETLPPASAAPAAVRAAEGARAMPSEPDEERAVVAVVRWPTIRGIRQQRLDVGNEGLQVQRVQCFVVRRQVRHRRMSGGWRAHVGARASGPSNPRCGHCKGPSQSLRRHGCSTEGRTHES